MLIDVFSVEVPCVSFGVVFSMFSMYFNFNHYHYFYSFITNSKQCVQILRIAK